MRSCVSTSLRGANGSRECAPDDRLRDEAIHSCCSMDCFASLAMTSLAVCRICMRTRVRCPLSPCGRGWLASSDARRVRGSLRGCRPLIRRGLRPRPGDVDGSACLTIFWHCGSPHLLFRRARASAPGNQPSTVLAEDDAFIGSGNADSQSNVRNSRASGRCRRSRSDSGCAAHRPASLRASASYQPLRAVWAFCAWALRGSREINRPPSALQRQRTSYKEFSK
jgi:hypothetical protein